MNTPNLLAGRVNTNDIDIKVASVYISHGRTYCFSHLIVFPGCLQLVSRHPSEGLP